MNEFLIVIHRDVTSKDASPSPQQMQEAIKPFQDWIGGIAAQNKLVTPPKRWDLGGKVIRQNSIVTNGPYAEIKESIGGMVLIRANDYEEAVEIAKGCPVLKWGAVVEVRMAMPSPTV
ncbi:MAG: transcription initiation protein [Marivirga sp.]|nr:transcription initiation protein [Marivirga sp.]